MASRSFILFVFCLFQINSWSQECENQHLLKEANDCLPCLSNKAEHPLVKTLLMSEQMDENEAKLKELESANKLLDEIEYIHWGRDSIYFNLDEEIKKALQKLNDLNPEENMDGSGTKAHFRRMRAFDLALKEARESLNYYCSIIRTMPKQSFNNATDGVCGQGNELNRILDQADDIMHRILELYHNNQQGIKIDCCDDQTPLDFHMQTAHELITLINQLQSYLDQMFLLHKTNVESTLWFAQQYRAFTGDIQKDLEKLQNLSFGGVVVDALISEGLISEEELEKIQQMIKDYNDMTSLQNAIRNSLGDDAADVFKVLFDDFTVKDLRENFRELVKNYPEKFKNLKKAANALPKSNAKIGKAFDAIAIAETSVQLFMHLLVSLDASGRISFAQDRWWLNTKWFYYNTLNSYMQNAIALKTYQHLLNTLNSLMAPQQFLCLDGPTPLDKASALKRINQALGLNVHGGQFENGKLDFEIETSPIYIVNLSIRFDDCYCGKLVDNRPAEITPRHPKRVREIILHPIPLEFVLQHDHLQQDTIISYTNESIWRPLDKIQMPPYMFGVDVGIRWFGPEDGSDFFEGSTIGKVVTEIVQDSGQFFQDVEAPTYQRVTRTAFGFNFKMPISDFTHININVHYSNSNWTSTERANYRTTMPPPCPTCPPETIETARSLVGTNNISTRGIDLSYLYENTALWSPIAGVGFLADYVSWSSPGFPLQDDDAPDYSGSRIDLGLSSTAGLQWKYSSAISIAFIHRYNLFFDQYNNQQLVFRLMYRP